jgi:cyclopropane-fatty-acyl-phospholipid synthase
MSVIAATTSLVERLPVPDALLRLGIEHLVGRTHRRMEIASPDCDVTFADGMAAYPIAEHTGAANAQHYELPEQFFGLVLGSHRKYSCCLYRRDDETLMTAEANALAETCAHADLRDTRISAMATTSLNSAVAGVLCRCGWPSIIPRRGSPRCRTRHRNDVTS